MRPQHDLSDAKPLAVPAQPGQGREAPIGLGLEALGLAWS